MLNDWIAVVQWEDQSQTKVPVPLPALRPELVIKPFGNDGDHVVKNRVTGAYLKLGPQESFLLLALEGRHTIEQLQSAFERRFDETISHEHLQDFIELAYNHDLLLPRAGGVSEMATATEGAVHVRSPALRQSILYWRKSIVDPDRLLTIIEPHVRFLWTRTFVFLATVMVTLAFFIAWSNRMELVSRFPQMFGWQMVFFIWLTLVASTTLHELSHGLTCKHYGGEVRELGFLCLFFTPCFYCNVSDAWLFREKSRRLWVTFAGAICDVVLWAGAVLVWRVTQLDTAINYLAFVVLSVCGVRIFFNLNPLLKLDGYYILSDWLNMPNLRQRSWNAVAAHVRWLCWGAPRPERDAHTRVLLAFGIAAWAYSLLLLSIMLLAFVRFLGARWGIVGFFAAVIFGMMVMRGMLRGLSSGEVTSMVRFRPIRTCAWVAVLGGVVAAFALVNVDRHAAGPFLIRPSVRCEVQAPVAGFLRTIHVDQGDATTVGEPLAFIEIPELSNRLLEKRMEIVEFQAKLRQVEMELKYAREDFARAEEMRTALAMSMVEHRNAQKHQQVCEYELEQTQARLDRLKEELTMLESQEAKARMVSTVTGVITTPHLKERTGQYVREGDLICTIEQTSTLLAEVQLPEQELSRARVGAAVSFKARALPFDTFHGTVQRIAPNAVSGDLQSSVTIYCQIEDPSGLLQSGMTGHARIQCGERRLHQAALELGLTFVRTEFWW